jgi:hypothetical protein
MTFLKIYASGITILKRAPPKGEAWRASSAKKTADKQRPRTFSRKRKKDAFTSRAWEREKSIQQ